MKRELVTINDFGLSGTPESVGATYASNTELNARDFVSAQAGAVSIKDDRISIGPGGSIQLSGGSIGLTYSLEEKTLPGVMAPAVVRRSHRVVAPNAAVKIVGPVFIQLMGTMEGRVSDYEVRYALADGKERVLYFAEAGPAEAEYAKLRKNPGVVRVTLLEHGKELNSEAGPAAVPAPKKGDVVSADVVHPEDAGMPAAPSAPPTTAPRGGAPAALGPLVLLVGGLGAVALLWKGLQGRR